MRRSQRRASDPRGGSQALDMLLGRTEQEGRPVRPNVILLNLTLPQLQGLALLERVRSYPDLRLTPVIVFSSSDDPKDIRGAYELGANGYVCKPVTADAHTDAIGSIVRFWHRGNRVAY